MANIDKVGDVFLRGFLQSSFEVLWGVIMENTDVATRWPIKHAQ